MTKLELISLFEKVSILSLFLILDFGKWFFLPGYNGRVWIWGIKYSKSGLKLSMFNVYLLTCSIG